MATNKWLQHMGRAMRSSDEHKPRACHRSALTLALLLASAGSVHAAVCRVTPEGTSAGSGANWGAQAMDLQTALGTATCAEVWVKQGVYKPSTEDPVHGYDRSISFDIRPGMAVYGGFAGSETQRSQRDPDAHVTVLSGDISDNDDVDEHGIDPDADAIRGTNAWHVVMMDGTTSAGVIDGHTVLDGVTITGGAGGDGGNTESLKNDGAGIYCNGEGAGHECSPSLSNLRFIGNYSPSRGSGLYNNGSNGGRSSPHLTHAVFSNNEGVDGAMYNDGSSGGVSNPVLDDVNFSNNHGDFGGAMFNNGSDDGDSSPVLTHVVFVGNSARYRGGAMYDQGRDHGNSNPVLMDVIFDGNNGGQSGGMHNNGENYGNSSPRLDHVTFINNTGDTTGGMLNDGEDNGNSSPSLSNVIFDGNHGFTGGAIYNEACDEYSYGENGTSSPILNGVTFSNNTAWNGGAMYNCGADGVSSPTLINVTFSGNSTVGKYAGGAMVNNGGNDGGISSPTLTNVTFNGNSADTSGGAMVNYGAGGTSRPVLNNVILWGDSAGIQGQEIYNYGDDANAILSNSVVQGGCPDGSTCDHISDYDPKLGALQDNGGYTPTMLPGAGGSAIDTGNNATCAAIDQRGYARPQDGNGDHTAVCDIGAVEVLPDVIFVNGFDGS